MKYIVLILSLAFLLFTGCGNETEPSSPPATISISVQSMDLWHRGVSAFQTGDNAAAIAYYDRAIEADRNNFHAYADKGLALSLDGDYNEGEKYLHEAVEIAPDSPAVRYNMAMHYKLQGKNDAALAEFEKVLATESQHAWSLYGIATIYADRGDTETALAYLAKAVKAEPAVKETARTQDHFREFHDLPRFREIVK